MRRLFSCSVQLVYTDADHEVLVHSVIADRAEFWWNTKRPDAPSLWDSEIELGEKFFNEIIAHPLPLDLHTLKALKRSPLGLDLYFWLTYRTFSLKTPCASRGGRSSASSARTPTRRERKARSAASAGRFCGS